MHNWLVASVSYFRSGGCPPKNSHSNFPMSPAATSWQLGDEGCNNEDQQRPSVSAFSFGDSAHSCYPEPRGLSATEHWEPGCLALISDIVGQDVNHTSGWQFVRPASSVPLWLVSGQRGREVYMPRLIYARGSVFSALFVGNTLSCSHTVAVCSIMVPHWVNVQLGTLNSSFLLSPPMFSEAYGSQVLSWIYGYMCRKHNTHKTEIPQCCFQACWGYIKIKQMTSLPWMIQIRGS